ncbi:hypothetical protein SDC9_88757 [bioreactor metagenome]|uniref:Uncharacterized protein n=1 Tax=bioreactor metagenome TaxID=1076179 RepID=A0A644ZMG7_9ZZZZ
MRHERDSRGSIHADAVPENPVDQGREARQIVRMMAAGMAEDGDFAAVWRAAGGRFHADAEYRVAG